MAYNTPPPPVKMVKTSLLFMCKIVASHRLMLFTTLTTICHNLTSDDSFCRAQFHNKIYSNDIITII